MRLVSKIVVVAWSLGGALGAALGIWADFPVNRAKLEDSMSGALSIGVAFLPFLALGVAITTGGILATGLIRWVVYLVNDGPGVAKFRSVAADIGTCKDKVIGHLETAPERSSLGAFSGAAEASAFTVELNLLIDQLMELKIYIPVHDWSSLESKKPKTILCGLSSSIGTVSQRW